MATIEGSGETSQPWLAKMVVPVSGMTMTVAFSLWFLSLGLSKATFTYCLVRYSLFKRGRIYLFLVCFIRYFCNVTTSGRPEKYER